MRDQHRVQSQTAGHRRPSHGYRWPGLRALRGMARSVGNRSQPREGAREHVYSPGVYQHRPGRQPDHGLSPGAMGYSHLNEIDGNGGLDLGMVSPDGRQGMIDHARQFAEANVPFIFDPGQGMTLFSGDELLEFVRGATWLTLNDYESQLLQQLTATSLSKLADKVEGMIVTLGGEGSRIYADGEIVEIPPATPNRVEDPTGCGDAYRAGLIYGVLNGLDWETTGRVASLMGAVKIEYHGTQNHTLTAEALEHRFQRSFGYSLADKVEEATFGREPV